MVTGRNKKYIFLIVVSLFLLTFNIGFCWGIGEEIPSFGFKEEPKPTPSPVPTITPSKTPHANPTPHIEKNKGKIESPKSSNGKKGSPVTLDGVTLFRLYARLGPYSPEARAKAVSKRLEDLAKNEHFSIDSIEIQYEKNTANLIGGNKNILTIGEADAEPEGLSKEELARTYREIIKIALIQARQRRMYQNISKAAFSGIIWAIVVIFLIFLTSKYFPLLYDTLQSWKGIYIHPLKLQRVEILSSEKIVEILTLLLKLIRFVFTLTIAYLYFNYVLSCFPSTRGISQMVTSKLTLILMRFVNSFISYIPNLVFILITLIALRYVLKAIHFIFHGIKRGSITISGFYKDWADPTYKLVRILIIAFGLAIIFPYLPGYQSPAFKGISIFVGVLLSLGSSSVVANVISGIVLTYTHAFTVGDRVKIGDSEGDVIEKTLLVTRLRTIKNVEISIPNSKVLSGHILNYSACAKNPGLILHTTITIGYDVPWQVVHKLLLKAAKMTPFVLKNPEPFILQKSLDDFYVAYELNAYTDKPSLQAKIYSDLHRNILDAFNEAGVERMSPHYSAIRDGNTIAIPEKYIPPSYSPPPFKVHFTTKEKKT